MIAHWHSLWQGRRGRQLREYLTAYLMIAPALALIFTFGIFPIFFALYVSLHRWHIRQGKFLGLGNYVKAIDALAYVLFFATALGLLYLGWRTLQNIRQTAQTNREQPWSLAVPGLAFTAAGLLFLRWGVLALPAVLGIADKALHMERTPGLFRRLLFEALSEPPIWNAFWQSVGGLLVAVILAQLSRRWFASPRRTTYLLQWFSGSLFLTVGGLTAWFTYAQLRQAVQKALESGKEPSMGIHVVLITSGLLLLWASWRLWQSAVRHDNDKVFLLRGFAALLLIVAGWVLIGELPPVIQEGDKNLWEGLLHTVYYALGTIPFQLSIALVLAYILFQNVWGREFFRVVYFLPYVTPAVASAAVFRLLFLGHPAGLVNQILRLVGIPSLKWLWEPRGVFQVIGDLLGISVPSWAGGPSLALTVVIIYSIWTFVGYDTVIYLAGLGNIDREINEAAAIDGASGWQIFRYVTLPLLSPTTYFLSVIAVIGTFKAFNHIYVMREAAALGTMDTFSVVIFDTFFTDTRYGYASAMAFILFAIILLLTYFNNKVQGSRVFYQ